jgi:methyl-accepting chemotaxis protein
VPSIAKTSDLVQEIASACDEQTSGTDQINNAISQITQHSASASEELAATAEEMSGQAEQLQQLIGFFTVKNSNSTRSEAGKTDHVSKAKAVLSRVTTPHAIDENEFVRF